MTKTRKNASFGFDFYWKTIGELVKITSAIFQCYQPCYLYFLVFQKLQFTKIDAKYSKFDFPIGQKDRFNLDKERYFSQKYY